MALLGGVSDNVAGHAIIIGIAPDGSKSIYISTNGRTPWQNTYRSPRLSKGEHNGKEVPVMTWQVGHLWDPNGYVRTHIGLDERGTAHYYKWLSELGGHNGSYANQYQHDKSIDYLGNLVYGPSLVSSQTIYGQITWLSAGGEPMIEGGAAIMQWLKCIGQEKGSVMYRGANYVWVSVERGLSPRLSRIRWK